MARYSQFAWIAVVGLSVAGCMPERIPFDRDPGASGDKSSDGTTTTTTTTAATTSAPDPDPNPPRAHPRSNSCQGPGRE